MAAQTYKFADLKQALKTGQPPEVINNIVAHLSAADINKAVKTFNPGLEQTLLTALTPEALQKVAASLDPAVAANLANLPYSTSPPARSSPPTSTTTCSPTAWRAACRTR